jgi:hypothetical protein
MEEFKRLLLIAGTGRNTGKTTLACSIIKKFSADFQIIGLKISPHFHGGTDSLKLLSGNEFFNIYEETSANTGKDSSKMLKAGAYRVFYIETIDEHLLPAFMKFKELTPPGYTIVCESPALRKYVRPGVCFIVDKKNNKNKKSEILNWKNDADLFIRTDRENISNIVEKLILDKLGWKMRPSLV